MHVLTRYQAVQALGHAAEEVVEAHSRQLAVLLVSDESKLVRHEAASTLGSLGPKVAPHAPALASALQDREMLVRRDAARALASAGAQVLEPHAKALVVALEDDFWPVRFWAGKALGTCGLVAVAGASSCGRTLARLAMDDPEEAVRETAAKALGSLGTDVVPHIKWLTKKLLSGNEDNTRCACRALASTLSGLDVEVRKILRDVLQPAIKQAQQSVKTTSKQEEAIAALHVALGDKDHQKCFLAIEEIWALAAW